MGLIKWTDPNGGGVVLGRKPTINKPSSLLLVDRRIALPHLTPKAAPLGEML